jgi:hypothetical protein
MTHDDPQLQNTVLVIACSDSPVISAVSRVLSSWKVECARDNEEALALVEKSAFICKCWQKEPDRFTLDPIHQMPGLNT